MLQRTESYTNTASLLLGLSSGEPPAAASPAPSGTLPGNPSANQGLHGAGLAGTNAASQEPITPAAVAAALMGSLPMPPTDEAVMATASASKSGAPAHLQQQPHPTHPPHLQQQPHEQQHLAQHVQPAQQQHGAWSSAKQRRMQVSALPRKEWSAEEDALIRNGVEQLGCRWRVIAAQLPGRSDDAVRNRWSRLQESLRGGPAGANAAGAGGGGVTRRQSPDANGSPANASEGTDVDRVGNGTSSGGGASEIHGSGASSRNGGVGSANGAGGGAGGGAVGGVGAMGGAGASGGGKSRTIGRAGRRSGEGANGESGEKKERTSWTRAEDDVIVQGVAELGHKWYEIARRLPGRTDHAIRNRWSRLQSIIGMQESFSAEGAGAAAMRIGIAPVGHAPLSVPVAPAAIAAADEPLGSVGTLAAVTATSAAASDLSGSSTHTTPLSMQAARPNPVPPISALPTASAYVASAAKPPAVAAATVQATLSVAALATVERSAVGSTEPPMLRQERTQGASGSSEGSDADQTSGPEHTNGAELLLLHAASQQRSPLISATTRTSEEEPPDATDASGDATLLMMSNKRPRV